MFSCRKLYQIYGEYEIGTTAYEALDERFTIVLPQSTEPATAPQETAPITVDFEKLILECADKVAWIYSPDTQINYPIVQAGDNEKYLRTLPDGTWNIAGTLFLDYRNSGDFSDRNSIVYGHNMKNDSMFGTLPDYQEQEYYEAHPSLYLLTPTADYRIDVLAGYVTSTASLVYTIPQNENEQNSLIQTALSSSDFVADVEVTATDRLITLSTCSYESDNARYVLVGVLKELAKNE